MAKRDFDQLEQYKIGFVEFYLKQFVKENDRILDAGCGRGQYRHSTSAFYVGIDITDQPYTEDSPRMLDIVASCEHIPSPENSYDFVFAVGVLCSISDPSKALFEFYRVLKPGGRVLICDYNRRTHKRLEYKGGHGKLPCWTQWELKKLIEQSGFKRCELLVPLTHRIIMPAKWIYLLMQEFGGSWAVVTGVK